MRIRPIAVVCAAVAIAVTLSTPVWAQKVPMRSASYEAPRTLPPMKLVIRDEAGLYAIGSPTRGRIDFSREMALFVCMGPVRKADAWVRITAVTQEDKKLVVKTDENPGKNAGAAMPRAMVIIPRSDLPVEGFSEQLPLGQSPMWAESSPVALEERTAPKDFEKTLAEKGWKAEEFASNPTSRKVDYVAGVLFDVGPDSDPASVQLRVNAVRFGRRVMATLSRDRRLRDSDDENESATPKVDVARATAAFKALYGMDDEKAKSLADAVAAAPDAGPRADTVMLEIPTKAAIDVDGFLKYIGADGRHFRGSPGDFASTQAQTGPGGEIQFLKPAAIGARDVEGLGAVRIAVSELGTFQFRVEPVKTTDVKVLKEKMSEIAAELGLKLDPASLDTVMFGYGVAGMVQENPDVKPPPAE